MIFSNGSQSVFSTVQLVLCYLLLLTTFPCIYSYSKSFDHTKEAFIEVKSTAVKREADDVTIDIDSLKELQKTSLENAKKDGATSIATTEYSSNANSTEDTSNRNKKNNKKQRSKQRKLKNKIKKGKKKLDTFLDTFQQEGESFPNETADYIVPSVDTADVPQTKSLELFTVSHILYNASNITLSPSSSFIQTTQREHVSVINDRLPEVTSPASVNNTLNIYEMTESIPSHRSSHAVVILLFLLTIVIIAGMMLWWWRRRRHQLEQLRLQLLPVYNYDPADDQDDWENKLINESNTLSPKEKRSAYSATASSDA